MSNSFNFARRALRGGTAFQALALMGAGLGATIAAAPATAQDFISGALVGTVQDAAGQPAAGATVTVRSNAQGFTRTATTGQNGNFRVPALPVGGYTVTITAASGETIATQQVGINAGQNNTYTFAPAGAADAGDTTGDIVVTGQAIRGNDFGTNTGGLTIGNVSELLNTTPIARNQTALTLLTPGVAAGDNAFGGLPSIGGATSAENQYYVNGLNVTNFRNFLGSNNPPIEFYQSFDVKTYGLSAEFGRALGGFTTTVTKAGSNTFKAGALVTYAPDALRDDARNTYNNFNQNDRADQIESNFYISGPIIKDRLFFYGLYAPVYNRYQDSSITAGQRVTQTERSPFIGGKLDFVIADGHRLEGTYFSNRTTNVYRYDSLASNNRTITGVLGSTVQKNGGDNFVGTYTGQFTNWLTLSASYGENHDEQQFTPNPNISLVQSNLTPNGTTTARGFNSSISTDDDTRKFFRADADVFVNLLGSHHFRGGYEQERLTSSTDTRYTGTYRYELNAAFIYRYNYVNVGTWKSRNESYYLQDVWGLFDDRLTLQLGVRNDHFNSRALDGQTFFKSGDQWGPRLGASLDVFGDKRTRVFGSWSRYFMPVATNTNIRLGGAELYYRQRFNYPGGAAGAFDGNGLPARLTFDGNGNITNLGAISGANVGNCPAGSPDASALCSRIYSDGVQGPTDTLVSSSLQPSYTDEWVVGAEQRLGDWRFSLAYVNRRLGRTLDDVAVDEAVLAYCQRNNIAGCGNVWTGFHQYVLANPGDDITVRLDGNCAASARQCEVATLSADDLGFPPAIRKYDSIQFSFDKPFSRGWGLGGSYVYTKLRGNYEGAVKSDNGQDDSGLTQDFDQPGLLDGAYGTLANQRAHQFKLFGSVAVTDTIRFGLNAIAESPRNFSCIGLYRDESNFAAAYENASYYCSQSRFSGRPNFRDPSSGRVSYLVDRGTAFKSDWNKRIDVNAQLSIPQLPGSYLSIDVFNVFNFKSKVDFQEFGDFGDGTVDPTYGEVTSYQAPRSVRFTFGLRFGEGQ